MVAIQIDSLTMVKIADESKICYKQAGVPFVLNGGGSGRSSICILKEESNFTMGYYRGTKGYIIEIGDTANGPWTKVAEGELPIPVRDVPVDITHLPLSKPQTARFVRFRCVSWWCKGCLLGYIGAVSMGE